MIRTTAGSTEDVEESIIIIALLLKGLLLLPDFDILPLLYRLVALSVQYGLLDVTDFFDSDPPISNDLPNTIFLLRSNTFNTAPRSNFGGVTCTQNEKP